MNIKAKLNFHHSTNGAVFSSVESHDELFAMWEYYNHFIDTTKGIEISGDVYSIDKVTFEVFDKDVDTSKGIDMSLHGESKDYNFNIRIYVSKT